MARAMSSEKPSLALIKKEKGEQAIMDILISLIARAQNALNIGFKMNPMQIQTAAELILERFYFLRIDELKLCFNNALAGDYGEIYNRIDVAVIMGWLNQYDETRTSVVMSANKALQANNIQEAVGEHMPELLKEFEQHKAASDKRINEEHLRIAEANPAELEKKPETRGEMMKRLSNEFMDEFDEIYNSQSQKDERLKKDISGRLIFVVVHNESGVETKWLGQSDFVELKLSQLPTPTKNETENSDAAAH